VSICSLALTMIFMAATFLTVTSPAGETVAQLLIMVSAPMFCSEYWVLSWFLWACLLMGTLCKPNKKREEN
jgi:hypothetical protein